MSEVTITDGWEDIEVAGAISHRIVIRVNGRAILCCDHAVREVESAVWLNGYVSICDAKGVDHEDILESNNGGDSSAFVDAGCRAAERVKALAVELEPTFEFVSTWDRNDMRAVADRLARLGGDLSGSGANLYAARVLRKLAERE